MGKAQVRLEALHQAYIDAVSRKDYRTCDLIRAEIQRELTGKPLLIPVEKELNLDPKAIFRS